MGTRMPAVAGQFYPGKSRALETEVEALFSKVKRDRKASAAIVPHAGYAFSGGIAALGLSKLKKFNSFVIMGPNHTGLGERISVSSHGRWMTPLGSVPVDGKIAKEIAEKSSAELDELGHLSEHSVEVVLPLLQHLFDGFSIVPVSIMTSDFDELIELGNALYSAVGKSGAGIVASSDFSHFVPLESAKEKDLKAIDAIKSLDIRGFHELATGINASICGVGPITALMQYCRKAGLRRAKMLKYSTSAAVTGDEMSVVGYASIIFTK